MSRETTNKVSRCQVRERFGFANDKRVSMLIPIFPTLEMDAMDSKGFEKIDAETDCVVRVTRERDSDGYNKVRFVNLPGESSAKL